MSDPIRRTPGRTTRRQFVERAALGAMGATSIGLTASACTATADLLSTRPSVRVAVPWSANELAAFRAVLADLRIEGYRVDPIPLGDNIDAAFGAWSADRPDIVMLPRIGLLKQHVDDLEPLPESAFDPAGNPASWPYPSIWDRLVFVPDRARGRPYGLPFKVADASVVWYRRSLFAREGLGPPKTLQQWLRLDRTLVGRGIAPLAVSGADGWMLTYVLANLVHTVCGARAYELLARPAGDDQADRDRHARRWTEPAVVRAFTLFAELLGQRGASAGGVDTAMVRQFPDAVVDVFAYHRAAMVIAPDFAESVIRQFADPADAAAFAFPADTGPGGPGGTRATGGSGGRAPHVLAGDVAVLTRPSTAHARDLVVRLSKADAPKPWIQRYGGFLAANTRTPRRLYSPELEPMAAMVESGTDRVFDMSDALGPIGASEGLWRVLQDLLIQVGEGATISDAVADATERMATLVRSGGAA